MDKYRVTLEIFEGPMDLLLYLIKKDEIDIYDIPISYITQQYIDYLEMMKEFNVELTSEFILMAATLMKIKSKTLLPKINELIGEEEEDPRKELVRRLLEYKKFQDISEKFQFMEEKRSKFYNRFLKKKDLKLYNVEDDTKIKEDMFKELNFYDLLNIFQNILEKNKEFFHDVVEENFTVAEKIQNIREIFLNNNIKYVNFKDMISHTKNIIEIISIFLAILELLRLKEIVFMQNEMFGDIRIYSSKQSIKR